MRAVGRVGWLDPAQFPVRDKRYWQSCAAGSGNASRSLLSTTPPRTALDVSSVSVVIPEDCPLHITVSCPPASFSVNADVAHHTDCRCLRRPWRPRKPLAVNGYLIGDRQQKAINAKFLRDRLPLPRARWRTRLTGRRPGHHHSPPAWVLHHTSQCAGGILRTQNGREDEKQNSTYGKEDDVNWTGHSDETDCIA